MIIAKASLRGSIGGGGSAYGYPDFSVYSLSKVTVVRAVEDKGIKVENSSNFTLFEDASEIE